jgi:hypothetical protein
LPKSNTNKKSLKEKLLNIKMPDLLKIKSLVSGKIKEYKKQNSNKNHYTKMVAIKNKIINIITTLKVKSADITNPPLDQDKKDSLDQLINKAENIIYKSDFGNNFDHFDNNLVDLESIFDQLQVVDNYYTRLLFTQSSKEEIKKVLDEKIDEKDVINQIDNKLTSEEKEILYQEFKDDNLLRISAKIKNLKYSKLSPSAKDIIKKI